MKSFLKVLSLSIILQTGVAFSQNTEDPVIRELRGRVFRIQHRDCESLLGAIKPLGSASKYASIISSERFNTITVRDFPENISTIEEAIRQLDAPEGYRPSVNLKMHILIASKETGLGNSTPPELAEEIRQVSSSFNYKSFYFVTSAEQKLVSGTKDAKGRGQVEVGLPLLKEKTSPFYEFEIDSASLSELPTPMVNLREFIFRFGHSKNPLGEGFIRTDLHLRDGESVVVGAASLKDKALVLVLSAKIVK
jgi:hypothetical protein